MRRADLNRRLGRVPGANVEYCLAEIRKLEQKLDAVKAELADPSAEVDRDYLDHWYVRYAEQWHDIEQIQLKIEAQALDDKQRAATRIDLEQWQATGLSRLEAEHRAYRTHYGRNLIYLKQIRQIVRDEDAEYDPNLYKMAEEASKEVDMSLDRAEKIAAMSPRRRHALQIKRNRQVAREKGLPQAAMSQCAGARATIVPEGHSMSRRESRGCSTRTRGSRRTPRGTGPPPADPELPGPGDGADHPDGSAPAGAAAPLVPLPCGSGKTSSHGQIVLRWKAPERFLRGSLGRQRRLSYSATTRKGVAEMPPEKINYGARGSLEALLASKHAQKELVFGDLEDRTRLLTDSEREGFFYTLPAEVRAAMWKSIKTTLKKERGL